MRRSFAKPEALTRLCTALMLAVLLPAVTFGCSQSSQESGGDGETREQAGTTTQRETTAVGETTQTPSQQRLQEAQEQAKRQQEQAREQRQQARQRGQQQSQQGRGQQERQGQQNQQGQQQTVTVRVTGTEGLSFSGRVGSAQEMRRVEGKVPEEYELPFQGAAVNAGLRKQEPGVGTLGVEVLLEGEVVASRETSTTPGVLNLVWTSR